MLYVQVIVCMRLAAKHVHQALLTIINFNLGINVIKFGCPLLQQTWKWRPTGSSTEQAGRPGQEFCNTFVTFQAIKMKQAHLL